MSGHHPSPEAGAPVGNVGNSYFESIAHEASDEFPTNPTGLHSLSRAIYPEDSVLHDWMEYARKYAESADCYLIGCVLPVIGTFLGRRVWFNLDRPKYPNLYALLAGKPGDRKTTAIKMVEGLGKRLLKPAQFSSAIVSLEALFDQYEPECGGHPDKILIADDANSVLANWAESSYGKMVAKKYLELYDCSELRESFRKNGDGAKTTRIIPVTSTSILFGATFNVCRFNKLDQRDGMSRRFLYYLSQRIGRTIIHVPQPDEGALTRLALQFEDLRKLEGPMTLSEKALPLWEEFRAKAAQEADNLGFAEKDLALAAALSEMPSHVVKVAMIFHLCRFAKKRVLLWNEISLESLQCAIDHVRLCVEASRFLDTASQQARIAEEADTMHANILCRFPDATGKDAVVLSKTALTNAFAKNPGRVGGIRPSYLYGTLIPHLIQHGKAKCFREGRAWRYAFRRDED
ncbi:MAG: DUF3987 domain-containing protein [Verrucomicrobiota bacterium JB022]|nr:DUF3987 domain-containing protein [Verrucomicrobiota bacterium JB022]